MKRIIAGLVTILLLAGCTSGDKQDNTKKAISNVQPSENTQPKKSSEPEPDTIFHASAKGQLATVMRLLNDGTPIDLQDEDGNTALAWAALRGKGGVAKYLLEHNANPNIADKKGLYPLHKACLFGEISVVQNLIDFGADVNAIGPGGLKAVDIARKMKHAETVTLLENAAKKADTATN